MASRLSILLSCFAGVAVLIVILGTSGTGGLGAVGQQSLRGERRLQVASNVVYPAGSTAVIAGQRIGNRAAGLRQHVSDHLENREAYDSTEILRAFCNLFDAMFWTFVNFIKDVLQCFVDLFRNICKFFHDLVGVFHQYFGGYCNLWLLFFQGIFAVVYYITVVRHYPYWFGPTPASCELQAELPPVAATRTSFSNLCLSCICPHARAAHTFDRTGILQYWIGLVGMLACPFCTLCYANACTDLNPKLGGREVNVVSSGLCAWFCPCCVIAQDAESLDAATGVSTSPCGISPDVKPYATLPMGSMGPMGPMGPMGSSMGPGAMGPMYPPQMMMGPGPRW